MTREEAIEIIKQDIPCEHDTDLIEALEMAIKALEQEPCDDAISREDALKLIYDFKEKHTEDREKHPINYGTLLDLIRLIRELPPVTPQPKIRHWIYTGSGQECSECHEIQYGYDNHCREKEQSYLQGWEEGRKKMLMDEHIDSDSIGLTD